MGSTQKLDLKLSEKVRSLLRQEAAYIVGGVEPLPIFPERAQGAKIWVSLDLTTPVSSAD